MIGRSRLFALVPVVAAAVSLLAACGGPQYTYQRNTEVGAAFKVPAEWTTFDKDTILGTDAGPQPVTVDPIRWLVGFDAGPEPSAQGIFGDSPAVDHPQGFGLVQELLPSLRDSMSYQTLRNFPFPVDALSQDDNDFRLVSYDDSYSAPGGFRGVKFVFQFRASALPAARAAVGSSQGPDATPLSPGAARPALLDPSFVQVTEVALLDEQTENAYYLVAWCDARCYQRNSSSIEDVIGSWTVRS
jgi:hypothetical protein